MVKNISLLALMLALCVIILGSYVRLSDAGLGCPDWPGCFGQAFITDSAEFKQQAKDSFPGDPVNFGKAWKEMTHRYLAAALALMVLLMALISWHETHCRRVAVTSTGVLFLLILGQIALGMWTVEMKVLPIIVTAHLLLGMLTFWLIYWIYLRVRPGIMVRTKRSGPALLAGFVMLILFLQLFLGAWVSTNYAALVCSDFPQCNGQWLPQADVKGTLDSLRSLTQYEGGALPYEAKLAVHWLHRVGALLVFLLFSLLVLCAVKPKYPRQVRIGGIFLGLLLLAQIILGVLIVKLDIPLWAALAHNGVAALLMLPLLYIRFYSGYEWERKTTTVETAPAEQIVAVDAQTIESVAEDIYVEKSPKTLYLRLKSQLTKTRSGLGGAIAHIALRKGKIDNELLEELEAGLIMADVGIDASSEIIARLTENVKEKKLHDTQSVTGELKQVLLETLTPCNQPLLIPEQDSPFVILVVGVNGVGKTTTIGKLAKRLQAQGNSVMLAAGDTFRAAAVEQLQVWGERNKIHVVAQHTGADSASVIFDGVQSAQAKGIDVLIADTAGRLHTKSHLMEELKKIKRIIGKLDENAPHEVLLVLDSGTGQNALLQTKLFNDTVPLTGVALTKLDGTAKGGIIFALAKQFALPIRYIGIGESIDDLQDFHADQFVNALFSQEASH